MKCRYGFLGFFSLIGLLGFWTDNPMFFPFYVLPYFLNISLWKQMKCLFKI